MDHIFTRLLEDGSANWADWMVGMAWQASIVIVIVAIASTLVRRRSATIAYAFWLIVLVRLLLPPDLALPTGWGW